MRLIRSAALVIAFLLAIGWSATEIIAEYQQRRCDSPLGKAVVLLKLDQYYSGCRCMKPALDFSDACNSMYVPMMM